MKSSQAISRVSRLKVTEVSGTISVPMMTLVMGTKTVHETLVTLNKTDTADSPKKFH
jgi:hypothetical protein